MHAPAICRRWETPVSDVNEYLAGLAEDAEQVDVTYFPGRKRPVLKIKRSRHRLVRFWRIAAARRRAQGRAFLSQSWRDAK